MRTILLLWALCLATPAWSQDAVLLRPARVFDGIDARPHEGWSVLVRGRTIEAAGPDLAVPAGTREIGRAHV